MKITKHPKGFDYKSLFSDLKLIKGLEGGVIYSGRKDRKPFLVIDESTLLEFLDESDNDLLNGLIKVIEFEDEFEYENYLERLDINKSQMPQE